LVLTTKLNGCNLKAYPGGNIIILNIYAPKKSPNHYQLWVHLKEVLPKDLKWLLCENFNMMEDHLINQIHVD
jgi:hypothetical protein